MTLIAPDAAAVLTGRWTVDADHSTIEFRVRHAGLARVRGVFQDVEGVVDVGPDGAIAARGSVRAASLTTRVAARDEHLRSADFFDVERHPRITFASTAIEVGSDGAVSARGDLTIRGVTRAVELHGQLLGTGRDDEGAERMGLEVAGSLDRRDFGLTWNAPVDGGGLLVGNRVDLSLELSAIRSADAGSA